MGVAARPRASAQEWAVDLLHLTGARPREATARARAILAGNPQPFEASVAHQVLGMVLRDFGDADAAITELRAALRMARATHVTGRQADVLATLGAALIQAGRSRAGLAALDRALTLVTGEEAGQVLMRRAFNLWILGRHSEALGDLRRAIRASQAAGDATWEARVWNTRALVNLARGATRRAQRDLDRAERLFATTSQELELAYLWHNRAMVAFRSGDLPLALSQLDEADRRYRLLDVPMPELSIDRCAVLLAAGLSPDALREADAGVAGFPRGGKPTMKAELLLSAAQAALAAGDPQVAVARAGAARTMFASQHRAWWQAHATLLLLRARFAAGGVTARLLGQAGQVAGELERLGSAEAARAHLLAGRVALALGRPAAADRHLALAARVRRWQESALTRAHGWLAEALRADAAGEQRRLLAACRQGFAVLDEYQFTLGASELRAQATAHGAEFARLAQRAALGSGRPRMLLAWSERWRATAQALPPARPADDAGLQAELTALRDVTSRLERARATGDPAAGLQREQRRLETAIRARVLRSRGQHTSAHGLFDVTRFLAELADEHLVQIVDVGGDLHVLVCGGGRVRHLPAGRADEAASEVEYARFGLRRLARRRGLERPGADRRGPGGPPAGEPADPLAMLETSGRRLESVLLGAAAGQLGTGPLVIVPPGRLQAVPWALLPSLRDRVVAVAPSVRAWLRARHTAAPRRRDPVLVRGPGLGAAGGEVPLLGERYTGASVLSEGTATARAVLAALDGAPLAHIAAHGTFRADSPLFSSLRLDDGPLTVHDFERLGRAPYRMILSACDSGVQAPAGADELLGLTSSLVPLGTTGIVASVGPVNDQATVELMLALHERLRAGATLAAALRDARASNGKDPVAAATGWSFIALGAT
jgi:tetratricopeptide (TPR) repeat protein